MLKSKGTHPIKWQEARNEPAQEPDGERERGREKERKVKKKKSTDAKERERGGKCNEVSIECFFSKEVTVWLIERKEKRKN